jgi:hypothetical protein
MRIAEYAQDMATEARAKKTRNVFRPLRSLSEALYFWHYLRRTDKEEHEAMKEGEIHDYARQLLEAHGAAAVAEAAQKASALEQRAESEQARTWRRVEAALKLMLGPHQM